MLIVVDASVERQQLPFVRDVLSRQESETYAVANTENLSDARFALFLAFGSPTSRFSFETLD
jgi:hypothetical protein